MWTDWYVLPGEQNGEMLRVILEGTVYFAQMDLKVDLKLIKKKVTFQQS